MPFKCHLIGFTYNRPKRPFKCHLIGFTYNRFYILKDDCHLNVNAMQNAYLNYISMYCSRNLAELNEAMAGTQIKKSYK